MTTARDVLQLPAVRRYLLASALASVGRNVFLTVVFKQVFDITGDALAIGFVGLVQFIPAVLLVLVSGWVADRFDRRRAATLALLGRVACAGGFVVFSLSDPDTVWALYILCFAYGAADAMFIPSSRSIAPLLAPTELFPRIVGIWTATFTASAIAGPVIGGFLYALSPAVAYGAAGGLELAAVAPLLLVVFAREPGRNTARPNLHIALEGLRFIRRTPVVLGTISLDLFAVLFGGAIALIPAVASDRLGVGDIAYGWLRAAPGMGAGIMALWLAVRPVQRRVGPSLLIAVATFGAATIAFGLTRSYVVAFAALVVAAGADMVSVFIRSSIVPLATPDDQLGRVTAVESVFIGASNELGAFESGVAARFLGVPLAIVGGGVATVAIAATFAVAFPSIRRIDSFGDVRPERVVEPQPT